MSDRTPIEARLISGHLDPNDLAAFLDGGASARERAEVGAHLSECSACCEELIAVRQLSHDPAPRRRVWLAGTAAAAAAVVALLVGQPWSVIDAPPRDASSVRVGSPGGTLTVEAVTPMDGAIVRSGELLLVWRATGGESPLYQLMVTTVEGDSVWAASTRDTVVPFPARLLEPNRTYLWYIDALLPDGRPASTGVLHFRTEP